METNIATLRKNKKISQSQLANIIGVSKQTICDWEKGRHIPNYCKLKQLSEYFCKPIDYLLEQEVNDTCQNDTMKGGNPQD